LHPYFHVVCLSDHECWQQLGWLGGQWRL